MNNAITYHRLSQANVLKLAEATVFDNPIDPEQLEKFIDDEGHELVFAADDERVVGFASGVILLHPDKQPAFFINEVDVTPAYQRRGIATRLCEMLIDLARSRGCKGIWLATEEANLPARALYRRLDARETKGIVVYDWDGAMDA